MNKADALFAEEGSLIEVPYIEPSFWEVLMLSPSFQGLMAYERTIRKMLCAICNILYGLCNMLSSMCEMLCVVCNMIRMTTHVTLMA